MIPTKEIKEEYRIMILCVNFMKNHAYMTVSITLQHDFERTYNNNFRYICVLEFCKLFADCKGKHFWKKAISQSERQRSFLNDLYKKLDIKDQVEWDDFIDNSSKKFRDKFLAHLDNVDMMDMPLLDKELKAIFLLYDYLVKTNGITNFPPNAEDYYYDKISEANDYKEKKLFIKNSQ